MYHHLRGRVVEKTPTSVVMEVNGVGYELMVPISTSQKLPAGGGEVLLYTHFVVREDAQILFGFLTKEEQALFRLLITVNGIGPKTAITVLSGLGIQEFKQAIVQGSTEILGTVPGIGRKTAERLVIELREKVAVEGISKTTAGVEALKGHEALVQDSVQALISLGITKQNAKTAIQKALSGAKRSDWNAEILIRESLKHI